MFKDATKRTRDYSHNDDSKRIKTEAGSLNFFPENLLKTVPSCVESESMNEEQEINNH